jgi:hypothetical protein
LCFRNENVNAYAIFIGSLGMLMHLCIFICFQLFFCENLPRVCWLAKGCQSRLFLSFRMACWPEIVIFSKLEMLGHIPQFSQSYKSSEH